MRIKSYFVNSIDEAIAQARKELGDEALLLNTRKLDASEGAGSGYEVVFGCAETPGAAQPAAESKRMAFAARAGAATAGATALQVVAKPSEPRPETRRELTRPLREPLSHRAVADHDLEQLRSQMDEIHGLLLSAGRPREFSRGLPLLDGMFARLMQAGFNAGLAGSIVEGVAAELTAGEPSPAEAARSCDPALLAEVLRGEISLRVKIDSQLGSKDSGSTVIAMVGPGGAGKTTTLMKIAAFQAARKRPVRLVSLDNSGLGNRMQLQFFARKTGFAFTAVENPETLAEVIGEARHREIVLIDTPSHQSSAEREQLAQVLLGCPGVDVHLVLPGYMSSGACREAIRKFGTFWPSKLVVTKLDETTTFGTLVSEGVRAGLSLSLVSHGVAIPDSLHAASTEELVWLALGPDVHAEPVCA